VRTKVQKEADKIDLEMFRVSCSLQSLFEKTRDSKVDDASRLIFAMRQRVQKHMHPDDIK
jgi:hypothetical protein